MKNSLQHWKLVRFAHFCCSFIFKYHKHKNAYDQIRRLFFLFYFSRLKNVPNKSSCAAKYDTLQKKPIIKYLHYATAAHKKVWKKKKRLLSSWPCAVTLFKTPLPVGFFVYCWGAFLFCFHLWWKEGVATANTPMSRFVTMVNPKTPCLRIYFRFTAYVFLVCLISLRLNGRRVSAFFLSTTCLSLASRQSWR